LPVHTQLWRGGEPTSTEELLYVPGKGEKNQRYYGSLWGAKEGESFTDGLWGERKTLLFHW